MLVRGYNSIVCSLVTIHSGFLLAANFGHKRLHSFVRHLLTRWLRFTPSLIGYVSITIGLASFGYGPLFHSKLIEPYVRPCIDHLWMQLLYINNWYDFHYSVIPSKRGKEINTFFSYYNNYTIIGVNHTVWFSNVVYFGWFSTLSIRLSCIVSHKPKKMVFVVFLFNVNDHHFISHLTRHLCIGNSWNSIFHISRLSTIAVRIHNMLNQLNLKQSFLFIKVLHFVVIYFIGQQLTII